MLLQTDLPAPAPSTGAVDPPPSRGRGSRPALAGRRLTQELHEQGCFLLSHTSQFQAYLSGSGAFAEEERGAYGPSPLALLHRALPMSTAKPRVPRALRGSCVYFKPSVFLTAAGSFLYKNVLLPRPIHSAAAECKRWEPSYPQIYSMSDSNSCDLYK